MYIRRTAGLINQVIHEHLLGNWFQKYVQKMHSWASTVLKDGSLTGDVLCWRDAHWSSLEQSK
eukprot:7786765-Heterocapsa_arctica.AAC.1